jgi:hypothetical protein
MGRLTVKLRGRPLGEETHGLRGALQRKLHPALTLWGRVNPEIETQFRKAAHERGRKVNIKIG